MKPQRFASQGMHSQENTSPTDSNQRAITHTLGNTLGQKPSLDHSKYGIYSTSGGETRPVNLRSLLSQNLLEEDGIEDLHFYFVSFN